MIKERSDTMKIITEVNQMALINFINVLISKFLDKKV